MELFIIELRTLEIEHFPYEATVTKARKVTFPGFKLEYIS
jgi:hypothetical protein